MACNWLLVSCTVLVVCFGYCRSFHFDLKYYEYETQCFMEELEGEITVGGGYKVTNFHGQNLEASSPGSVRLEVTDPNKNMIFSKEVFGDTTFAFSSNGNGMYTLCFTRPKTIGNEYIVRVNLHYEEIATSILLNQKKHFSDKGDEDAKEKIFDGMEATYSKMEKNMQKLKKKEKIFRELSATTNSRVLWWALFQIVVLALTAAWQMRHLTRFFILKKLA